MSGRAFVHERKGGPTRNIGFATRRNRLLGLTAIALAFSPAADAAAQRNTLAAPPAAVVGATRTRPIPIGWWEVRPETPPTATLRSRGARQQPAGIGRLAIGGLAGGVLGVLAGGVAGAVIGNDWDCTFEQWVCAVRGGAIGAVVGESVLLPLGIHLADGRRGSYGWALAASVGIGALGAATAYQLDAPAGPIILAATPVLQLAAGIAIERRTR